MGKIIAAINMTIDGFCDHTVSLPDEEIHQHYAELIDNADTILYGRITYELMQFWQTLLDNPSGKKSMDDFAVSIDRVPKIVFSKKLKSTGWDSAKLAEQPLGEVVSELRKQPGGNILIGSRSLIVNLLNQDLLDELQLCIHPILAGKGLPLFDQIKDNPVFKLLKTKTFPAGHIILYYRKI